jgi:NAD(P)H dehydrogenase (quinone)
MEHLRMNGSITMSQNQPVLLVTGASGHLGRRVVELLLEKQAGHIIAATRTPDKLADFASQGVTVRHADFSDAASLNAAFAGVDRLLLISTDTLDNRLNMHRAAVQAAEQAGVKHVVYTSLVNPVNTPVTLAPDHAGTEAALEASRMGWTSLRMNLYAETLVGAISQALQLDGKLFVAAGDGKAAYITREDCAQAAAGALAADFDGRRALDITGSEALSQADIAAIATGITGKEVTYVPIQPEAKHQNLVAVGLPPFIADLIVSFDTGIAAGKFAGVTNNVEVLSGRKPIRISDFLAAQRDALQGAETH